jgi:hypothetical protein
MQGAIPDNGTELKKAPSQRRTRESEMAVRFLRAFPLRAIVSQEKASSP